MPYPTQFPYELLDASPSDDTPTLLKRWGQAIVKRRAQQAEVRHALDQLKNPRTRLAFDILLVERPRQPSEIGRLIAEFSQPPELPDRVTPAAVSHALTGLACDSEEYFEAVHARVVMITEIKRYANLPPDISAIPFDRRGVLA